MDNMDNEEKKDNFTNDDIFNYLRGFKDEVAKDNKLLEKKKVEKIEYSIEEKLEKMTREIEENKIKGGNMMEEINKRIEMIEKEVFKDKNDKKDKKTEDKMKEKKAEEKKRRKKEKRRKP